MNKKITCPIFTVEFKESAVKLVTEQGYTRQEVVNNLGMSLNAMTRWVRAETQVDSKPGSKQSTLNISGRARIEILRKENNRLKMECDILNKTG
jgi:transposase